MIRSFSCRNTNRLFHDIPVEDFKDISFTARRRLAYLHRAKSLDELKNLKSADFSIMKGTQLNTYKLSVDKNWDVQFQWVSGQVKDVKLIKKSENDN